MVRILLGAATVAGVTGAAATAVRADQDELRLFAEAKAVLTQALATAERHLGGQAIGAKLDRLAPVSAAMLASSRRGEPAASARAATAASSWRPFENAPDPLRFILRRQTDHKS